MAIDLFCLLALAAVLVYARTKVGADFLAPDIVTLAFVFALPFLSVAVFVYFGLYRLVTRYTGRKGWWRIGYSLATAILLWAFGVFLSDMRGTILVLPRSIVLGYFVLGWLAIWLNRQAARWWLMDLPLDIPERPHDRKRTVVIYGAGDSGLQILKLLIKGNRYNVVGFLDDDASLWGLKLEGYKVHPMDQFESLIADRGVQEVLIAIPSLGRLQKRKIIARLEPCPVEVKILPSIEDLVTGRIEVSDMRPIAIDDLLGRDPVMPFEDLMTRSIDSKVVMVTGAGGSIGSEISRQVILNSSPVKLILLELSELALYTIETKIVELEALLAERSRGEFPSRKFPEIVAVLGSVGNEKLMRDLVQEHEIDTIYHCAAFKHIPLLEKNPVAAIENNVFATVTLARVAQEEGVESMVLVSSDKAVRPGNIKGASNRLQELIMQAMAAEEECRTVFSIVRFGNVLDSSGSVVPRFREQIRNGGPVTVTHHEIIRYFMSIEEAAQLVIQAGAMARGGEIYVLDMGEPVKIDDLARTMIRLSGKEVRDENNPDGDVEIKYVGLRPGDKMYEELLIAGNVIGSRHPYILRLSEPSYSGVKELSKILCELEVAANNTDINQIREVLLRVVEGYGDNNVSKVHSDEDGPLKKRDARELLLH